MLTADVFFFFFNKFWGCRVTFAQCAVLGKLCSSQHREEMHPAVSKRAATSRRCQERCFEQHGDAYSQLCLVKAGWGEHGTLNSRCCKER